MHKIYIHKHVHNTIEALYTAAYEGKEKKSKNLMMTICQLHSMQLQKEVKSNSSNKKVCSPLEGYSEIQGGDQEMAVMVR